MNTKAAGLIREATRTLRNERVLHSCMQYWFRFDMISTDFFSNLPGCSFNLLSHTVIAGFDLRKQKEIVQCWRNSLVMGNMHPCRLIADEKDQDWEKSLAPCSRPFGLGSEQVLTLQVEIAARGFARECQQYRQSVGGLQVKLQQIMNEEPVTDEELSRGTLKLGFCATEAKMVLDRIVDRMIQMMENGHTTEDAIKVVSKHLAEGCVIVGEEMTQGIRFIQWLGYYFQLCFVVDEIDLTSLPDKRPYSDFDCWLISHDLIARQRNPPKSGILREIDEAWEVAYHLGFHLLIVQSTRQSFLVQVL